MKSFAVRIFLTALVAFIVLIGGPIYANGPVCSIDIFRQLDPGNVEHNQVAIAEYARKNGLPAFKIEIFGRHVPVILLNKKTIGLWSWVLENTLGIAHSMNPGNDANHG